MMKPRTPRTLKDIQANRAHVDEALATVGTRSSFYRRAFGDLDILMRALELATLEVQRLSEGSDGSIPDEIYLMTRYIAQAQEQPDE